MNGCRDSENPLTVDGNRNTLERTRESMRGMYVPVSRPDRDLLFGLSHQITNFEDAFLEVRDAFGATRVTPNALAGDSRQAMVAGLIKRKVRRRSGANPTSFLPVT